MIVGVTFTTLLLVLPAAHLARWTGVGTAPWLVAMIAFPFATLLWTLIRPQAALTHGVFFLAHLPALAAEPGLSGPLVYSESVGLWAFAAIGCVGGAWLWVCRAPQSAHGDDERDRRSPVSVDGLGALVGVVAATTYGAFVVSALGSSQGDDAFPRSLALLVGLTVSWYVAGVLIANRLGDVVLEEAARRRILASLFVERRRSNADLWTTILWLAAASTGALLWYLV